MNVLELFALFDAMHPQNLPSLRVSDIKSGLTDPPKGMVRIHARRKGLWRFTEPVDAASVEWGKLLDNDRVEVIA